MAQEDAKSYRSAADFNAAMKKQDEEITAKEAAKKNELDDRIAKDIEAARKTKGYGDVCKPLEMTQDGKPMCGSCKAVEGGSARIITHYFGCPCKKGGKRTRTKKSKRSKSRSKKARKTRRRV